MKADILEALICLDVGRFKHVNGSLLSHLKGTYELLSKWGNREALCNAGLYHSIYGTQDFKLQAVTLDERSKIRDIIGEEAERIVFYFSVCDRDYLYTQMGKAGIKYRNSLNGQVELLDSAMTRDLLELTMANELEILINYKGPLSIKWKKLLRQFKGYVSDAGFQEYVNLFGKVFG